MKTLETDLDDLSTLNEHRRTVQRLLECGIRALSTADAVSSSEVWDSSGGPIERALLMKVLNKPGVGLAQDEITGSVRDIKLQELLTTERDKVPVLLASRAMQALVASSEDAFSRASLVCYYRILREIFMADSPDWSVGGARAGSGGESSAYVTAQCVRAILGFIRTLEQIGVYFAETHKMYRRKVHLKREGAIQLWETIEIQRMGLAWYTSVDARIGEIALKLERKEPQGQFIDLAYIDDYLTQLSDQLPQKIAVGAKNFQATLSEIRDARDMEESESKRMSGAAGEAVDLRFIRSESAHKIAEHMVQQALTRATQAAELCKNSEARLENLGQLGNLFDAIAADVRRSLSPATRFIATVLDRELAAASSSEKSLWDVRELAFAAAAFGSTGHWNDERLLRACTLLADAVTEGGEFPLGRPFHSRPDGTRLHTLGFEVCECLSLILEHVDVPVPPELVGRMLQLFHRHQVEVRPSHSEKRCAWHFEHPPIPRRATLWASALAVMALDRTKQMLNEKINARVLSHFTYKKPADVVNALDLDTLTYPDFGRRYIAAELKGLHDLEAKDSVAMMLEMMRAHVLSVRLPKAFGKRVYSSVLYGPPGTGKTTLLEALACSCKVPLVELSPSDIAVLGQEAIESRARAIFKALSMLTRVVVIFDEFEPVLLRRDDSSTEEPEATSKPNSPASNEQRSMFTFLTPSMLPKLTRLHEAAEEQNVVYCLVTNHLEKIDEAAIREGRFDMRIGIYHPDLLSRAGALRNALFGIGSNGKAEASLNRRDLKKRLYQSLLASAGVSVQRFAKRYLSNANTPPAHQQVISDRTELLKQRRDHYQSRLVHWEIDLWLAKPNKWDSVLANVPKSEPTDELMDRFRYASIGK